MAFSSIVIVGFELESTKTAFDLQEVKKTMDKIKYQYFIISFVC